MEEPKKQLQSHVVNLEKKIEEKTSEVLEKNRRQKVIAEIGKLLWAKLDRSKIMDMVVVLVSNALKVEFCKILLLDKTEKLLHLISGVGWKDGLVGRATVGIELESQAGYTLKERVPIVVKDLRTETRFSGPSLLVEHGIVSGLSVPMIESNSTIGVMGVHTAKTREFSKTDIDFLQSVGNFMAVFIRRTQIGKEIKRSKEYAENIIKTIQDTIYCLDKDGRFTYVSLGIEDIGFKPHDLIGTHYTEIVHPDDHKLARFCFNERRTGKRSIRNLELRIINPFKDSKTDEIRKISVLLHATGTYSGPNGKAREYLGAQGSIRNITDRKKFEQRVSAQHAVTRILAESISFNEAASKILQIICTSLGWDYGEIWMVDQKDNLLRCTDMWHISSINLQNFKKSTKQITFSSGVGLPGRVWSSAKSAWITDVVYDKNFIRASIAAKENLHAAFAFPIFSDSEVLGVMVFFGREKKGPDSDLINMMSALGSQIGVFIKRKQAEEQVSASLKEKEILLKEIHHRVKNNMQVISSLLNLQAARIEDKKLLDVFKECQNRVKSMAQIHEELYQTEDLANIEFAGYVRKLTNSLIRSYAINPNSISLILNIDNVSLCVDKAIPCGLIINELFSNSLKYAFPDITENTERRIEGKTQKVQKKDNKGEISINFTSENNRYILLFSDNGVGLPEDLDFQNSNTLGLDLANSLTQQLGGTIELDRSKGTEFKIVFEV